MEPKSKVIIIGAGIAGISLALFLDKIGVSAEIYELRAADETTGGGLNIAPNGMNVLAELGLANEIIRQGCPIKDGIFLNASGKRLARMVYSNPEKYPQPAVSIRRQTVVDILRKAVRNKNIPVHYGRKLTGITQSETCVSAIFDDEITVVGDLLIGADGVHSAVRNIVTPDIHADFTGVVSQAGFISRDKLPDLTDKEFQDLHFIFGKNGFFGFSGANNAELMWWTNVISDKPWTREQLRDINVNYEKSTLNEQYGGYCQPIQTIINSSDSYMRINVFDVRFLPTWSKNRIVLIGDAAHAVSPNSGQGASMALEDAMLLARLLRDEKDYSSAFSLFESDRRPRVEKIVLEGRKRGEDKLVVGTFQQFIRETMIRIFVNLFGAKGNDWLFSYRIKW